MTPIAIALTDTLLAHHHHVCQPGRSINTCRIPYLQLCQVAAYPDIVQSVGRYLRETADWCVQHGYPPINSLAVNGTTQMPGDAYDMAPGCSLLNWPAEAQTCIDFQGYPPHVP